jgi:TfoX/Sxy family transcriptional regulator of competence genes
MINYNEALANKVRAKLAHFATVEEKIMFNGLTFMVNGKLCIGVKQHELLVRINPEEVENVIERNSCRQMIHGNRPMKGYIFIEEEAIQNNADFNFWINLALEFNPLAKASKK